MRIDFEQEIELQSNRLVLKVLNPVFASKIADYYKINSEFFKDISAIADDKFYTEAFQLELLWQEFDLMVDDRAIRFYMFLKDDDFYENIIGDVSVFNIVRGCHQSCYLGFKLDKIHCGKGYMAEALDCVIDYVFKNLKLHKIESYIQSQNNEALKLLTKLGFEYDGISKHFAFIDGMWIDYNRHIRILSSEQ